MSSSSNDPYKSRLFNFLNSQTVRLKDRVTRGLRHLKNAAAFGLQIVLYPLYLLVQAGRMTRQQLRENVPKIPLLLTDAAPALPADQPILKVLEAIEPQLLITTASDNLNLQTILNPYQPTTTNPQFTTTLQKTPVPALAASSTPNPRQLQGIATVLANRHLVLVTQDNGILDILAPQDQEQLEKRIYLEMANYYYQRRIQARLKPKVLDFTPVLAPASPKVLAPLRIFWEVMRWEQSSEVASSINLFGETTLTPVAVDFSGLTLPEFFLGLTAWWSKMQPLTPGEQTITLDSSGSYSPSLSHLLQTALSYFYGSRSENLLLSWQEKTQAWLTATAPSLERSENTNPFAVQVLIAAAIEYFFVKKAGGLMAGEGQPQLTRGDEDPWLMWEDLYPEVVPNQVPDAPDSSYRLSLPSRKTKQEMARGSSQEWLTESVGDEQWLDAEAEAVGYVQHPLEKILGVLDRVILWLEELFVGIYQGLKSLWERWQTGKK